MILYIHGFGGSGLGVKASLLREKMHEHGLIAPSLSYVPMLAIESLKELISSVLQHEKVYLIGSSLGGYYAIYLADYFNIPAVLINPSIYPYSTLERLQGQAPNFYDGSHFEWNNSHIASLKEYEVSDIKPELYMLLAQKGDEVLDYSEAVEKLRGSKSFIEEGGSHSFEGIDRYINPIAEFFGC
jgi:predicted esterase YcpF (UPF0227 family)